MRNFFKITLTLALACLFLTGCQQTQPKTENIDRLTVGVVQKDIKKGMASTDVIVALGSPNIVKTGPEGKEVWVYDKFSKTQVYQTSGGTLGYFSGNAGGVTSSEYGSNQVSSSTLTVIIKFDTNSNVETIAYHRSKF
jgi:outer membrane protein assembly factor BamE (lipoprotein component of BamABCDE complex)